MRRNLQELTALLLAVFTALLPLKCGTLILPGVPNSWPDGLIGWLVTAPPPAFFVLVSGGLLALALAAYGMAEWRWRRPECLILAGWLLLVPVGALGLIQAGGLEPGVVELSYFAGLSAYAGSVYLLLARRGPEWRMTLLNAAAAGVLLTAAVGVYQYFFGFDELRQYVLEQEKLYGVDFSAEFKARIWDVRTYATFTFASALAGCLLLTAPLTVALLWRWGRRFEPVRLSQWLFAALGGLMLFGVFLSTKGRGAFLAAVLAAAGLAVLRLKSRKLRLAAVLLGLAVIAGGACYIHWAGRGFGSMTERVGYIITSAQMIHDQPWCGEGWGDFVHRHARMKFLGNEELAKDPHNIVASFAGQVGIPGLLYILSLLGLPLFWAWRRVRVSREAWRWALFGGLAAFYLHAMMDLDLQVPGLMALMILAQFALIDFVPETNPATGPGRRRLAGVVLSGIAAAALLAGIHWTRADWRLERLLDAAGQTVGAVGRPTANPAAVRKLVDEAAAVAPYSMAVYLAGGNYMLAVGNLTAAEQYFLAAQRRSPEYWLLFSRLADVYERRGDADKAVGYRKEAERRFPLNQAIKERKDRAKK